MEIVGSNQNCCLGMQAFCALGLAGAFQEALQGEAGKLHHVTAGLHMSDSNLRV